MRFRIALALCASLVLIGAATWLRFSPAQNQPTVGLVAIETSDDLEQEFLRDFLEPSATGTAASSTKALSNTDVIGRQLLAEFVALAQTGATTPQDIVALAERYIESIPTVNSTQTISYSEVDPVSNSGENFRIYAEKTAVIYNKYISEITEFYPSEDSMSNLNEDFYSSMAKLGDIYQEAALELKSLSVPGAIAEPHIEIINSFLSSASALEAIANTESDATAGFAAIVLLNENQNNEVALIQKIEAVLVQNGI